jgi:Mg2+ and Co2+ transporter CorA
MHKLLLLILCIAGCSLAAATPPETRSESNRIRPPEETEFTNYKNRFAFIVGISQYQRFSKLEGPAYDAVAVANILAERYGFSVYLLTDNNQLKVTEKVQKKFVSHITKETITNELRHFRQQIEKTSDSLLVFYYSGHGLRTVKGDQRLGFIVPANGDEKKPETVLALAELAKEIADYQAHHTLFILDSCYSGAIFEPASQVTFSLGKGKPNSKGGLERGLSQPVVQAITAGASDELVDDQADISKKYKNMRNSDADRLSKHSPFTAMLTQALAGRIGIQQKRGNIPMGTIAASTLGYEMHQSLMDSDNLQFPGTYPLPRYRTLVGQGNALLMPVRHVVLNPRIISPLYLPGERYQALRASAISALLTGSQQTNRELVLDALPHLNYALSDTALVQDAALDVLIKLVNKNGQLDDFGKIIKPLIKILNKPSGTEDSLLEKAARLLGKLPELADDATVRAMVLYLEQRLKKWKLELKELEKQYGPTEYPTEVSTRENTAKLEINIARQEMEKRNFPQAVAHLEKCRERVQWLLLYGTQTILADQPLEKIEQLDSVIEVVQGTVRELEEHTDSTLSELEEKQKKLDKLFAQLTNKLGELGEAYSKYQKRYPDYKRLYDRYYHIDAQLNDLIEYLPEWRRWFGHFNEEVDYRGVAIKQYVERQYQPESVSELSAEEWQKEIDKLVKRALRFHQKQTLEMCRLLVDKADSERLSNYLLSQLLSEFVREWFGLDWKLEKDTWFYNSARKILTYELQKGTELRKQLEQGCQSWIDKNRLQINWEMLYDDVVIDGMKVVNQYLRIVNKISPLIEPLNAEIEEIAKRIIKRNKERREIADKNIRIAEEEATRLQDEVENTENAFKEFSEEFSTPLSTRLSELKKRQQHEKNLLESVKKAVEQIREYLCRERGEDCHQ